MLNEADFFRTKQRHLLAAFSLAMIVLILALFFNFYTTASPVPFLLSFAGLSSIVLALFMIVSSSPSPKASLGFWFTFVLSLSHGGGWILTRIFGEQHYSRPIHLSDVYT